MRAKQSGQERKIVKHVGQRAVMTGGCCMSRMMEGWCERGDKEVVKAGWVKVARGWGKVGTSRLIGGW